MNVTSLFAAVLVAGAALLCGCGGGDNTCSQSPNPPPAAAVRQSGEWVTDHSFAAQVESVVPLSQCTGRSIAVSDNPQYALTLKNIRPILGEPPATEGGTVIYAISTPAKLLGTKSGFDGKWFRFTVTRSKVTGNRFLSAEAMGVSPPPAHPPVGAPSDKKSSANSAPPPEALLPKLP